MGSGMTGPSDTPFVHPQGVYTTNPALPYVVNWTSARFDNADMHTGSTPYLAVPEDGLYNIKAGVMAQWSGAYSVIELVLHSSRASYEAQCYINGAGQQNYFVQQLTKVIPLTAGQLVWMHWSAGGGTGTFPFLHDNQDRVFLQVRKIGANEPY